MKSFFTWFWAWLSVAALALFTIMLDPAHGSFEVVAVCWIVSAFFAWRCCRAALELSAKKKHEKRQEQLREAKKEALAKRAAAAATQPPTSEPDPAPTPQAPPVAQAGQWQRGSADRSAEGAYQDLPDNLRNLMD